MFVAIISSEERIHFIGYMILIYITMIVLIIILLCQVPFTWIASILLWDRSLFRCPMPYSIHWYVTFINQFVPLSRFHHRSIRWSKYRSWEDCHDASCAPIVCKFIIAECSWLRLYKAETSLMSWKSFGDLHNLEPKSIDPLPLQMPIFVTTTLWSTWQIYN